MFMAAIDLFCISLQRQQRKHNVLVVFICLILGGNAITLGIANGTICKALFVLSALFFAIVCIFQLLVTLVVTQRLLRCDAAGATKCCSACGFCSAFAWVVQLLLLNVSSVLHCSRRVKTYQQFVQPGL